MAGKNISQPVSDNAEYQDLLQNIGIALNNGRQKTSERDVRQVSSA